MSDRLGIGIHEGISEKRYHADPAIGPSASASILKTLYNRSPAHARWDHPRLNPLFEADEPTDFQIDGTILHSLILGTEAQYEVLGYDAYRSNDAKAAKKEVLEAGRIPILRHKYERLPELADKFLLRIAEFPQLRDVIFEAQKEVTLIWRENGVLCRSRVDVLPPAEAGFMLDLKFTSRSAEPEGWGRTLTNEYLFQAALYPRGVKALRGDKPEFWFLVCETDAPYGMSLHSMDPQLEDLADRRLVDALSSWDGCIHSGRWHGYSHEVHYQSPPPWEMARTEERIIRRDMTSGERYRRLADAAGGPPT